MIAKLSGRLDSAGEDSLVLDVGGVGYLLFCSTRTREALPGPGGALTLHVETHVREDHIHLYGFHSPAEREWFRILTTVQGVGARLALAILSAFGPERLADLLAAADGKMLTQAPGVGPRLAGRIVSELKDKAGAVGAPAGAGGAPAANGAQRPVEDAVSALVNLGYRRGEAFGAVAQAARDLGPEAGVEALVRAGLRGLAS